eukprot:13584_1
MEGEDNWDMSRHGFINQRTAKAHLKKVADIITRANPDIVVMQEVGGCGALTEVRDNLGADIKSKYNPYVIANFDTNKQHVGILTRLDPIDIGVDRDASRLKASYFEFHVKQLKRRNSLKLYGIHLIGGMNKNLRERQTNALKDWIRTDHNNLDPYVIVMGDFNDWDFYKVPKRFLYVGDNIETINQNLNKVMTDVSGLGTIKSKAVDKIRQSRSPVNMINAMYFAEKWQRKTNMAWTPRAIDHIMMTEELAKYIQNVDINTDIIGQMVNSPQQHGYIMVTLDLTRYKDVYFGEREIVYDDTRKVLKSMTFDSIDKTYFVGAMERVEEEIKSDKSKILKIQKHGSLVSMYALLTVERGEQLTIWMDQKKALLDPVQNELVDLRKIQRILTENDWGNVPQAEKDMFIEKTAFYGIWKGQYKVKPKKAKYKNRKKKAFSGGKKKLVPAEFPPIPAELTKAINVCNDVINVKTQFENAITGTSSYKAIIDNINKTSTKVDEARDMHRIHQLTKEQLLRQFNGDETEIQTRIQSNKQLLQRLEDYQEKYTTPIPHLFAKTSDREYGFNLDFSEVDVDGFKSNIEMDTFIIKCLVALVAFSTFGCYVFGFLFGYLAPWIFKKY